MTLSGREAIKCLPCYSLNETKCEEVLSSRLPWRNKFGRFCAIANTCINDDAGWDPKKIERLSQLVEGKLEYSSKENQAFLDSLRQQDEHSKSYSLTRFQRFCLNCISFVSWIRGRTDEQHYQIVAQAISSYMNDFFKDCIERFQKEPNILYSLDFEITFLEACSSQRIDVIEILFSYFEMNLDLLTLTQGCEQLDEKPLGVLFQNISDDLLLGLFDDAIENNNLQLLGRLSQWIEEEGRFAGEKMTDEIRKTLQGFRERAQENEKSSTNTNRYWWHQVAFALQRILSSPADLLSF